MSWKNLQSFRISLVVVVTGFFLAGCEWEPDIIFPNIPNYSSYGGYYGKVINNNTLDPISDAKITCNNQLYKSNIEGFYEINASLDDLEVTIKVSKDGYQDYIQTVRLKGEETKELNISLIPVE